MVSELTPRNQLLGIDKDLVMGLLEAMAQAGVPIDWGTVWAARRSDYLDVRDVVSYAQEALSRGSAGSTQAVVRIAAAESADGSEVDSILDQICASECRNTGMRRLRYFLVKRIVDSQSDDNQKTWLVYDELATFSARYGLRDELWDERTDGMTIGSQRYLAGVSRWLEKERQAVCGR